MSDNVEVFLGSAIEVPSEQHFLERLKSDLSARGHPALLFANFLTHSNAQVDFLAVCGPLVLHIELKNWTAPVIGHKNGPWHLRRADGTVESYPKNPYRQALDAKHKLSDDMHRLARDGKGPVTPAGGRKFYDYFQSVICIYPEILSGSHLPRLPFVMVAGYAEVLNALCQETQTRHPWDREDWLRFAMDLNLFRQDETAPAVLESRAAHAAIESYSKRFNENLALHELVPTRVRGDKGEANSDSLLDLLVRGTHAQLIAPSGFGKTHLVQHMARHAVNGGWLPIFVPAMEYEGKLSSLLDRSVAHLHPHTAVHLVRTATAAGRSIALIIDGVNEVRPSLRSALIKDLQALYLRWKSPIVFTAQEKLELPAELSGPICEMLTPTTSEREQLVASYSPVPVPPELLQAFAAFSTPYELSLAAQYWQHSLVPGSRAGLFDAYISRQCHDAGNEQALRLVLGNCAHQMGALFKRVLSLREMWQTIEETLGGESKKDAILQGLTRCKVLKSKQGQWSFSHDLLQDFLEAEALLRRLPDEHDLCMEVARPKNRRLADILLGIEREPARVRCMLEALASPRLIVASLRGEYGSLAAEVSRHDVESALARATESAARVMPEVRTASSGHQSFWVGSDVADRSAYETALLTAIGEGLQEDRYLGHVFHIIGLTDQAWTKHLSDPAIAGLDAIRDDLFSSVYLCRFMGNESRPAAALIVQAMGHHWKDEQGRTLPAPLLDSLQDPKRLSPGQLFLLCKLDWYRDDTFVSHLPALLRACLQADYYHLNLEVLQAMAECQGLVSDEQRDELLRALGEVPTDNIMLNGQLIETLVAYGAVESPVSTSEAFEELKGVLLDEDDPGNQQRAMHLVSNVFEEIYQGAFWEAIDELSKVDRARLFTMAALGAEPPSLALEWVLGTLLRLDDPRALPAFIRWSEVPPSHSAFTQWDVQVFVYSLVGCAQFQSQPPLWRKTETETCDEETWRTFGEIIFWSAREELSDECLVETCKALWRRLESDLRPATADVLVHLKRDLSKDVKKAKSAVQRVFTVFHDSIRRVLHWALEHGDELTTHFENGGGLYFSTERTALVVHQLGVLGDSSNIPILKSLVDDPDLGETAVDAIRRISARLEGLAS